MLKIGIIGAGMIGKLVIQMLKQYKLNVIVFVLENVAQVGLLAVIIMFQPELRKALEQLGQQNIISSVFNMVNSSHYTKTTYLYK